MRTLLTCLMTTCFVIAILLALVGVGVEINKSNKEAELKGCVGGMTVGMRVIVAQMTGEEFTPPEEAVKRVCKKLIEAKEQDSE